MQCAQNEEKFFENEEFLVNLLAEQEFDIFCVCEVDIKDFNPECPFVLEGYKTFFPLHREGSNKKRLLCFVKESIEVNERSDMMSPELSNVWLEINAGNQKIFIATMYR